MPVQLSGAVLKGAQVNAVSPAALFAAGEQGVWFDPSDMSTMFQDFAGTTPLSGYEQPVGLILDKSKGLALGPELVTNGTFDSGITGWTNNTPSRATVSWNSTLQRLRVDNTTGTGDGYVSTNIAITSGKTYRITLNYFPPIPAVPGTIKFYWYNGTSVVGSILQFPPVGSSISFIAIAPSGANSILIGSNNELSVWEIDNVSVRELPGNYAFQSTSASRPVLSARYNLLTRTEEFDNAVWTKGDITVVSNNTVAPNGTTTADLFTENAAGASAYLNTNIVFPANTRGKATIFIKPNANCTWIRFYYGDGSLATNGIFGWFNVVNGTVGSIVYFGTGTNATLLITPEANNFFRLTIEGINSTATSTANIWINSAIADASNIRSTNASYWVWGADLRVANDGVGLPPYQRVGAAVAGSSTTTGTADYDTAGFPPYLRFDGIDDSLSTSSINFTSSDEMSVFAGVRKLSDTASGMIVEIGDGTLTSYFFLRGPTGASAEDYEFRTVGVGPSAPAISPSNFISPITNVLTGLGDISSDISILRINSSQVASNITDQGSGTYGNHILYIGRRNNASLPFNGRLYSLIVRGAATTNTQINAIETWTNLKTRAY